MGVVWKGCKGASVRRGREGRQRGAGGSSALRGSGMNGVSGVS